MNCQICNEPLEDSYAIDKEKLYHPACHSKAAGVVEEGLREVFIRGCKKRVDKFRGSAKVKSS